jgi:RimJ/RimL family protein N-acetyltransferase
VVIARTDRLTIRRWLESDLEPMTGVLCDPDVMRFSNGVMEPRGVADWLRGRMARPPDGAVAAPWAVVERATGSTIGYCGFFSLPDVDGNPETEIGYRLARDAWRKGYATEAALAVRNVGFEVLGFARLVAMIDPGNLRSIRVAEKIGMHYEKDVMLDGYTHSDRLYVVESPDPASHGAGRSSIRVAGRYRGS